MICCFNEDEFRVDISDSNSKGSQYYNIYYADNFLCRYYTSCRDEKELESRLSIYLENYMTFDEVLIILDKDDSVPTELKKAINHVRSKGLHSIIVTVFMIDYARYRDEVVKLLVRTAEIISKSIPEVIQLTDYSYKDTSINRLSDAFAEMRTVIELDEYGFSDISLLSASSSNRRRADIIANYDNNVYAIDVAHKMTLDGDELKYDSEEKILKAIEGIYYEKKGQLISTCEELQADSMMIACVIDEISGLSACNELSDLYVIFERIFKKTSFSGNCGLYLQLRGDTCIFLPKR